MLVTAGINGLNKLDHMWVKCNKRQNVWRVFSAIRRNESTKWSIYKAKTMSSPDWELSLTSSLNQPTGNYYSLPEDARMEVMASCPWSKQVLAQGTSVCWAPNLILKSAPSTGSSGGKRAREQTRGGEEGRKLTTGVEIVKRNELNP